MASLRTTVRATFYPLTVLPFLLSAVEIHADPATAIAGPVGTPDLLAQLAPDDGTAKAQRLERAKPERKNTADADRAAQIREQIRKAVLEAQKAASDQALGVDRQAEETAREAIEKARALAREAVEAQREAERKVQQATRRTEEAERIAEEAERERERRQAEAERAEQETALEQARQLQQRLKEKQAALGTGAASPGDGAGQGVPGDGPRDGDGDRTALAVPQFESDGAAQSEIRIGKIESAEAEAGKRIDNDRRQRQFEERARRGEIVGQFGDRFVVRSENGALSVYNTRESQRWLRRRAVQVFAEELSDGRLRETVLRSSGVRIVTIYNRFGDIIHRSRFDRDGREAVMAYVAPHLWNDIGKTGIDPGADLPPRGIEAARGDHVLEARLADGDDYYGFLSSPPVERVERLYSIDEVRRSARLREKVRHIDLDTITFQSGSARVGQAGIDALQSLAWAILAMLEENPAETFLIEGHTDAVGADVNNAVLSDRRAESVAEVLTDIFGVPPENLVTQGYGEQFLKVDTEGPEDANRRVAVRRITPLVSPASQYARN